MVNVRGGPNGSIYFFDERVIGADGRFSLNLEALFLNAFNHPNYLIGNANAEFGSDVNITSTTFGQSTVTAAGPRNVQLRVQINF
jgi:hypothetical protein